MSTSSKGSCLDHTSCGVFSMNTYVYVCDGGVKVRGTAGHKVSTASESDLRNIGASCHPVLIDIDSLQQLNRMHGQSMGEISLSQHIQLHT